MGLSQSWAGFIHTEVDYAGPLLIKSGPVRKPLVTKAYIFVFVSFSVRAAHLELVTELTIGAFIATLRRFIAQCGKPSVLWSDHGANFVGVQGSSRNCINSLVGQWRRMHLVISVQQKVFSGNLHQYMHRILEVCERLR